MTTWTRQPDVARVDSPGRTVLLNLERLGQPPVVLEGAACEIYDSLIEPLTTNEVVVRIRDRFPSDGIPADLHTVVSTCLEQLATAGLLTTDRNNPETQ